jgi:hypothetical protein
MYSILILGAMMLLEGAGIDIPQWVTPLATVAIIGGFFLKSLPHARKSEEGK